MALRIVVDVSLEPVVVRLATDSVVAASGAPDYEITNNGEVLTNSGDTMINTGGGE